MPQQTSGPNRIGSLRIIGSRGGAKRGIWRLLELSPFMLAGVAVILLLPANIWLKVIGTSLVITLALIRVVAEVRHYPDWIQSLVPVVIALILGLFTALSGESIIDVLVFFNCLRVAFTGNRRILLLTLAATLFALAVPALIYPDELGATAIIWMLILPTITIPVQMRSKTMIESAALNSKLAGVLADLITSTDARQSIVKSAHDLGDADVAIIFELDGLGGLEATAAYGVDPAALVVLGDDTSALGMSISNRQTVFAPYLETVSFDAPPGIDKLQLASTICCPIMQGDVVIGSLCVGWKERVKRADLLKPSVISILAEEAAATMAHSDLVQNLADRATHDTLTGLPNRRAWERLLRANIEDSRKKGTPLSVAILDLDHFKLYNDKHGHQTGDRLLREAATAWKSALRKGDMIFRWGGEEFTVILPDCDPSQAVEIVERLRAATPEQETSSAGVATWNGEETPAQLFKRTDTALYRAKEIGRDQTVTAEMPASA